MADNFKIGASLALDGEAEFKKAITDINKDMNVLGSEMKKVTAQFADNSNSVEALTAKQEVLNKQLNDQTLKVNTLKAALDGAKGEYGDNSDQVQQWQIKLNNAEAVLAKTESQLKQTTNQIDNFGKETNTAGNETKQLGEDFTKAEKKALSFGDVLKANLISDAVVGGIRAIGAAVAAMAQEFVQLATSAMDSADNLKKLSDETGLTTEQLQVMQYQGDDLGVSLDTMTGSMSKMINNMSSAKAGTGTAAEAFKTLGISVTDSSGNLRDSNAVYAETLAALGGVANETERTAIAQDIFGKSAVELNPLIKAGTDGLAELEAQAYATGAVMSEDTVAALDSLGDSLDHMKQSITTAAGTFVAQFAPALQEVSEGLTGLLSGTVSADEFIASIQELVTQATTAITGMLPNLLQAGGGILTALIEGIVTSLPEIIPAMTDVVLQLVSALIENLPAIIEAGLQVIVSLALGIAEALPELIPTIVDVVLKIVDVLIDNIDLLVDASIAIVIALAEGIIEALPKLIEKAPEIIIKLVEAIIENTPKLLMATVKIIEVIAQGIASLGKQAYDWGADMLSGFIDGIKSKFNALIDSIKDVASTIASYLHFSVPDVGPLSKYESWMPDFMSGMAAGIEANKYKIKNAIDGVAKQMSIGIPTSIDVNGTVNANARMLEGAVNGMASVMGVAGGGTYILQTILDGKIIAQSVFDPLKALEVQKGTA